ncbi:autoinducer binding domain-containing protein [Mesorhizobium sp.]|uniref:autoinducer binding domain-containing protein n=1 Tax=Mesorhizobium sp. TaxID=1871066 RepID=UPI00344D3213
MARSSQRAFQWDRRTLRLPSASQQRFFAEAAKFRIHSGATVPIQGGFGRFAAFTIAGNRDASLERGGGLPNDGSRPLRTIPDGGQGNVVDPLLTVAL